MRRVSRVRRVRKAGKRIRVKRYFQRDKTWSQRIKHSSHKRRVVIEMIESYSDECFDGHERLGSMHDAQILVAVEHRL